MNRLRLVLIFAIMALGASAVPSSFASVNGDPTLVELSTTTSAPAAQAVGAFVQRQLQQGHPVDPKSLRVYAVAGSASDLLITPRSLADVQASRTVGADGTVAYASRGSISAMPSGEARSKGALDAPYWGWAGNYCASRVYSDYGYMDWCWVVSKLYNDGNGSADYYTLYYHATAGVLGGSDYIKSAWLEADENSSASSPMSWFDWSPGGDTSGGCTTVTLSISVFGVGISQPLTRCEQWDITKFADAGHFKNEWKDGGNNVSGDRYVGFLDTVSVPQGGTANWWINSSHTACWGGLVCDTP